MKYRIEERQGAVVVEQLDKWEGWILVRVFATKMQARNYLEELERAKAL